MSSNEELGDFQVPRAGEGSDSSSEYFTEHEHEHDNEIIENHRIPRVEVEPVPILIINLLPDDIQLVAEPDMNEGNADISEEISEVTNTAIEDTTPEQNENPTEEDEPQMIPEMPDSESADTSDNGIDMRQYFANLRAWNNDQYRLWTQWYDNVNINLQRIHDQIQQIPTFPTPMFPTPFQTLLNTRIESASEPAPSQSTTQTPREEPTTEYSEPNVESSSSETETPFTTRRMCYYYQCQIPPVWKRLLAEFCDGLLLLLVKFYFVCLLHESSLHYYNIFTRLMEDAAWRNVAHRFIGLIFETYFLYFFGQTPGKMLFGLKIYTFDNIWATPGNAHAVSVWPCRPLGWWRAFFRTVLKNIKPLLAPVNYGLAFTMFSQVGYDLITRTIVTDISHFPITLITHEVPRPPNNN